jgi:hypothetical protein
VINKTRGEFHDWLVALFKAKLLIHLFATAILSMKKLEIKKTKATFIISVLKVGLVLSNSKKFINKSSQGRKSVREKNTFFYKFNFRLEILILDDKYTVSSGVGIDVGFDGCVRNLKIGNHHSKEIDFSKGQKISKGIFQCLQFS